MKKFLKKVKKIYKYHFGFSQYYNIPFEFPKPLPSNSIEVMKKGCDILKKLSIKHCISYGTLLGIYRDNHLIPHDSDIDVEIVHPVNTEKIEKEFTKNGFTLCGKVVALGKTQQLAFYTDNEVIFDISFYQKFGSYVYCFQDLNLYFKFPALYYEKFTPFQFSDYIVYTPNNPEEWLAYTYGKNWRIPKAGKPKDWHEEQQEYGMIVKVQDDIIKEIKRIQKSGRF